MSGNEVRPPIQPETERELLEGAANSATGPRWWIRCTAASVRSVFDKVQQQGRGDKHPGKPLDVSREEGVLKIMERPGV